MAGEATEQEPAEEADEPRPFDAYAYYSESKRAASRDASGLLRLSRAAVALAREASPRTFALVSALQVATVALLAAQVLLAKVAIERVIALDSGDASAASAVLALVGLVAVTAGDGLVASTLAQVQRVLGERVARLSWARILGVTTSVPLETFESHAFFDALQRVKTLAVTQPLAMTQGIFSMLTGALGVVAVAVVLVAVAPLLLPIVLLGGLPLALLARRGGRLEFDFTVRATALVRLRGYLTELLAGRDEAKEIRAFDLGPRLMGRWADSYESYLHLFEAHVRRRLRVALAGAAVTLLVTAAALAVLLSLVASGDLALASAGSAVIAVRLLSGRVSQVSSGMSALFESGYFLRDFEAFQRLAPDERAGHGDAVPEPFGRLETRDLRFRYPGTTTDVLDGVSLSIGAGEVVALVGENGSGKTTLAKVLAGMFTPTGGQVLWDGTDTRSLAAADLRSHVGVVFQDFVRYQLTARENVALGRERWLDDPERLAAATRLVGIDGALQRLPDGYETVLGREFEGGADLSGGQWQRVALARAFFRDAAFLVLDEPTSALDARAESELFETVTRLAAGRSVLLISHRFSTVKGADRIVVLDAGRVLESGTHAELMARGGRYAELFELQARSYR